MDIRTIVKERRSIRKFKPDPIPESLLREILDEARWSPSWGNTQPWEFYIVTGEALKKLREANCIEFDSESDALPDIKMPTEWTAPLKARYNGVGKCILEVLRIARGDASKRAEHSRAMYNFFDAPCLIVSCVDKQSSSYEYAMLDVGLITQTLCLLAHNRGLGTCILACSVRFPNILRQILPNTENKLMAIGIAIGYPDSDEPINNFDRERAPLDELTTWVK